MKRNTVLICSLVSLLFLFVMSANAGRVPVVNNSFEVDVLADGAVLDATTDKAAPAGWDTRAAGGYNPQSANVLNATAPETNLFTGGVPDGDNIVVLGLDSAVLDFNEIETFVDTGGLIAGEVYQVTGLVAIDTIGGTTANTWVGLTIAAASSASDLWGLWGEGYGGMWTDGWAPDITPGLAAGEWVELSYDFTITQGMVDGGGTGLVITVTQDNRSGGPPCYCDDVTVRRITCAGPTFPNSSFEADALADGAVLNATTDKAPPAGWDTRAAGGYNPQSANVLNATAPETNMFTGGVPDGDNIVVLGSNPTVLDFNEIETFVDTCGLAAGEVYELTMKIAIDTIGGSTANTWAGPTLASAPSASDLWGTFGLGYEGNWGSPGWVPDISPGLAAGEWFNYSCSLTITQAMVDAGATGLVVTCTQDNRNGGAPCYFDDVTVTRTSTPVRQWKLY